MLGGFAGHTTCKPAHRAYSKKIPPKASDGNLAAIFWRIRKNSAKSTRVCGESGFTYGQAGLVNVALIEGPGGGLRGTPVFHFFASNDGNRARASVIGGLLAATTLAFAMPSAAAEVYINSHTPLGYAVLSDPAGFPDTSNIAFGAIGGDLDHQFSMAPYETVITEGGIDFTVLAFCVDFTTDLPWDFESHPGIIDAVNHDYKDGSLDDVPNFDNNLTKVAKVYNLLNVGQTLWLANPTDYVHLAAVQGAIWQVMTGQTFGFGDAGPYGPENDYLIQDYAGISADPLPSNTLIRVLVPVQEQTQVLAYAVQTAVPEPESWALMIGGFAGMGSMLRFRRRALARA